VSLRVVRCAVAVAVALVALTGCGGNGGSVSSGAAGGSASTAKDTLDGCTIVSTQLLNDDLGLGLTAAGTSSPSFFGAKGVSDCAYFEGEIVISVYVTNDAGADITRGDVDPVLASGGTAIPGADRGVALTTNDADGSTVNLLLVKGTDGIQVAVSTDIDHPVTEEQAVKLGTDVVAALG
jgi:hypothetical protein